MKAKIEYELDLPEEEVDHAIIYNAWNLYACVENARYEIRYRFNYKEDLSDEEEKFLITLLETLYVEGIDL